MSTRALPETPTPLVIVGGGTLAQLAYAYFHRDSDYDIVACSVHREYLPSTKLHQLPTVPFEDLRHSHPSTDFAAFVAVGYAQLNARRAAISEECASHGYDLATLVSSRAQCWADLAIGSNCLVFDGVVIEPNVVIGDGVIVWSGSQISHDTSIADHAFVGPNAVLLGNTSIGARSFIGGNATIRDGVTVAEDCIVGAGAVIKSDTERGEVYSTKRTIARAASTSSDITEL